MSATDRQIIAMGKEARGPDDGMTPEEKIRRCAPAEAANLNSAASDKRIIEMGRQAQKGAHGGMSPEAKIRRCAGTPDNEEMNKALAATEAALADLEAAHRRPPAETKRRPTLARISAGTGRRHPPSLRTPAPAPRPATPAAAAATMPIPHPIAPAVAMPIAGPSGSDHHDGRSIAASLGFYSFRDRIAGDIRAKLVRAEPGALIEHAAASYGLTRSDAADWTGRFLSSVSRELDRRAA